MFAEH